MPTPVDTLSTGRRRAPEARPQQILDAAFHEFGERGLAGTRLDDIARRAGVAKGTIYLYFPNKEALFEEMVRTTLIEAIAVAEQAQSAYETDSIESLTRKLAAWWWQFLRTERVTTIHRLAVAELHHFPELMQFYADEVVARGRRLVAGIIARGVERGEFRPVDPQLAARMFSAIWLSHSTWAANRQFHPTLGSDEQLLAEMLDFYLVAIKR
jgi:AcrR family transcriptional regulator